MGWLGGLFGLHLRLGLANDRLVIHCSRVVDLVRERYRYRYFLGRAACAPPPPPFPPSPLSPGVVVMAGEEIDRSRPSLGALGVCASQRSRCAARALPE